MAKNNNSNKTKTPPPAVPVGVEFYFDKFAASHQNPANRLIYNTFIPLLIFGFIGIIWTIPFPNIKFLGAYNADFNWASVLLAVMVYYYIRKSAVLGYFMLFIMLIFFYIITQLVQWQNTGGPNMGVLCLGIYFISFIALFIGYKMEGKKLSFEYRYKNMLIAPIFLLHLVLRRFKVKY